MSITKRLTALVVLLFVFNACSSFQLVSDESELPLNKTTQATLWVQNSTEYKATTLQAYNTAERLLALSLEDSYWTASLEQEQNGNYNQLPPAIILDIDETVLDNSPFQARMIKEDKTFNIEDWNAWCEEANAEAIPGSVAFTNLAADKGISIFYITNRGFEVEDATRRNLIELGFPVSENTDNIMTNGEEPGWNSSKIQRRKIIEDNYRVLMIFGDDLNDFLPAKDITQDHRNRKLAINADKLGEKWFMLPNPVYGSWEDALFNFKENLGQDERNEILKERLNTKF